MLISLAMHAKAGIHDESVMPWAGAATTQTR